MIDAFEVYIADRFAQTITNVSVSTNSALPPLSPTQASLARKIIARRPARSERELDQAASVVQAFLCLRGRPLRLSSLAKPAAFIAVSAWPLALLGAIPSLAAALLFRRGPILRMYGLEVLRRDGTKASHLRILWRNLLARLPALLSGPALALFCLARDSGPFSAGPRLATSHPAS